MCNFARRSSRMARDDRLTLVQALGDAKSALYEAHALTRTGGIDAISSTDGPYWDIFCEVEGMFLAEVARRDATKRELDELLTAEYGPAYR